MTDEKWLDLIYTLKQKFDVTSETEDLVSQDDVGQEINSHVERLIFESPMGKVKVERVTRPMILDKKVHYSHTAGNKSLVEYVLSPDEKTHKVTVFKDDDGKWEELNINSDNLRF